MKLSDRIRGCALGGAIGDALGAPIEFQSLTQIQSLYGPGGLDRMLWHDPGPLARSPTTPR
jgi:ADP-ribosylglycohydrolase